MHNYYTQMYNDVVFRLLEKRRGIGEAVLFARSATAGGQRMPIQCVDLKPVNLCTDALDEAGEEIRRARSRRWPRVSEAACPYQCQASRTGRTISADLRWESVEHF